MEDSENDTPKKIQRLLKEVGKTEESLVEMMMVLIQTLEERDHYTRGHSERVGALSVLIGEKLGLDRLWLDKLSRGGQLHDIGKIGIPDDLLNKPGIFTQDERARMNQHSEKGHFIILKCHLLWDLIPMIRNHHENFDGTGYPDNLKGGQIPIEARIVSLADYFDALATERPYKKPFSKETSVSYIMDNTGKKFDPEVVQAFLKVVDDFYNQTIKVLKLHD